MPPPGHTDPSLVPVQHKPPWLRLLQERIEVPCWTLSCSRTREPAWQCAQLGSHRVQQGVEAAASQAFQVGKMSFVCAFSKQRSSSGVLNSLCTPRGITEEPVTAFLLVYKHKFIFSSYTMLKHVRHGHTLQINFSFQYSVWQASSSEQWNPVLFALPWISVSLGCCCCSYRILKRPFVICNKWFKSTKKCRVLAAWLGTTYW